MMFAARRAMLPVLGFWFGRDAAHAERRMRQWLRQDPGLGPEMAAWAEPLARLALTGNLDHLAGRPLGSVALAALLDAIPRVLWRGSAQAYAGDLAAQGHVVHALATRQDARLDRWQRMMLYMPLMHAENMELQNRSLHEYEKLRIGAVGVERELADAFHGLAVEHREVIWRFGRFPDRNAVLHRKPGIEETWYLHDHDRPWFAPQPVLGEIKHDPAGDRQDTEEPVFPPAPP